MTNAPICKVHGCPAVWKPDGVSKTGKPYKGFWSCPQRNAYGSFCTNKFPRVEPSPEVKFMSEIEQGDRATIEKQKGDAMGRNNIAHAMIRAGRKPDKVALIEAETWFQWSSGAISINVPQSTTESADDEISIDEIENISF